MADGNLSFLQDSNDDDNDDDEELLSSSLLMEEKNESEGAAGEVESFPTPPGLHSYLPGTPYALHAVEGGLGEAINPSQLCLSLNGPFELILIELPGVVLFPGMTIPLRLEEPGTFSMSSCYWQLYRQIQNSRRFPGQSSMVQVGVLTKLDAAEAEPDNRRAIANEARIRRRSSWMRRSFGPQRLQRFSELIIRELGGHDRHNVSAEIRELTDSLPDSDHPIRRTNPRRPGTFQPRRSLQATSRSTRDGAGGTDDGEDDSDDHSDESSSTSSSQQQLLPQQQHNNNVDQVEFLHRRRGIRSTSAVEMRLPTNMSPTASDLTDPYVGRIGTLATVTFMHGDNYDEVLVGAGSGATNPSTTPRQRTSLILTAVGTGRFCILPKQDRASGDLSMNNSQQQQQQQQQRRHNVINHEMDLFHYRLFVRTVQEWSCERMPRVIPPANQNNLRSVYFPESVWPKHVYDHFWPWNLMNALKTKIGTISSLKNVLQDNMPCQPLAFSYWLGANLPLSERERLIVLQCPTVTERLRWFLHHHSLFLDDQSNNQSSAKANDRGRRAEMPQSDSRDTKELICKSCQIPITSARHLFTLGGAEGTLGNYVNPHGVVHATMTVRSVCQEEVILQGRPEIRDSWFPGYAWTIMSCALCYSHLGWKFTRVIVPNPVQNNHDDDNDNNDVNSSRPPYFYGLSSTGVTLTTNPRRRSSRNQRRRTGESPPWWETVS